MGEWFKSGIKRMFYDWDQERQILLNMQKCQRNWDYEKFNENISTFTDGVQEVVDELLWVATNTPSKQHEGYYDIYWTADRDVIQECSRYTWGYTFKRNPPATWRNSQANASIYILWVAKEPHSTLNSHADGRPKENTDKNRWQNAYCSIGISLALTMRAANKMNLSTGANKSHNDLNGDDFWPKKLGIFDEVKNGTMEICYGLGIGYAQEGRPRWESDEHELMIGAANGSKLTTTGQETHPRTGKKILRTPPMNPLPRFSRARSSSSLRYPSYSADTGTNLENNNQLLQNLETMLDLNDKLTDEQIKRFSMRHNQIINSKIQYKFSKKN